MIHTPKKILKPIERNQVLEFAFKLHQILYCSHRDEAIRGLNLSLKSFKPKAIVGKLALLCISHVYADDCHFSC